MKRVIKAGVQTSLKNNVRKVVEMMDYNNPTFCDKCKDGYKVKWGGRTFVQHQMRDYSGMSWEERKEAYPEAKRKAQEIVEDIRRITGVDVYLNRSDNLVIPFYYDEQQDL